MVDLHLHVFSEGFATRRFLRAPGARGDGVGSIFPGLGQNVCLWPDFSTFIGNLLYKFVGILCYMLHYHMEYFPSSYFPELLQTPRTSLIFVHVFELTFSNTSDPHCPASSTLCGEMSSLCVFVRPLWSQEPSVSKTPLFLLGFLFFCRRLLRGIFTLFSSALVVFVSGCGAAIQAPRFSHGSPKHFPRAVSV